MEKHLVLSPLREAEFIRMRIPILFTAAITRGLHGDQERQFTLARACGRAREQAARGRLHQDLHDTGFCRSGSHVWLSAGPEGRLPRLRRRRNVQLRVDAPNHLLELDDAGVRILLEKKLPSRWSGRSYSLSSCSGGPMASASRSASIPAVRRDPHPGLCSRLHRRHARSRNLSGAAA